MQLWILIVKITCWWSIFWCLKVDGLLWTNSDIMRKIPYREKWWKLLCLDNKNSLNLSCSSFEQILPITSWDSIWALHSVVQQCHSQSLVWDIQVNWGRDDEYTSRTKLTLQLMISLKYQEPQQLTLGQVITVLVVMCPRLGVDVWWSDQQDFAIWIYLRSIHQIERKM